jgi:hypothetical protein
MVLKKPKERRQKLIKYGALRYKGDLERLTTFEKLIPILEKEKPEVMKAWRDYKASKMLLNLVITDLV